MSAVLLDVIGRQSNWRFSCKPFISLASPTGFEPVLPS